MIRSGVVSGAAPPWLAADPPWWRHSPAEVVVCPKAPWSSEVTGALREGAYIPMFGLGATEAEARRVIDLVDAALGPDGDSRPETEALGFVMHPGTGTEPLRFVAERVQVGEAPEAWPLGALGAVLVLGGPEPLRAVVAEAFRGVDALAGEVARATALGGGRLSSFREHYEQLRRAEASLRGGSGRWALMAGRLWFDFVLGRRWQGLDGLRALHLGELDGATRWLAASAELIAGAPGARAALTVEAEAVLAPVAARWPRLVHGVARSMAQLVGHPMALRWHHLQCAAARDHASVAVRHWLNAARDAESAEGGDPDDPVAPTGEFGALSPEPSRAGQAAEMHRQRAGEFLLDWFVGERAAARAVDGWAEQVLGLYHRLHGVELVLAAEAAPRPRPEEGP